MKFRTEGGVATIKERQDESKVVYLATVTKEEKEYDLRPEAIEVENEDKEQRIEPIGELKNFILDTNHPDHECQPRY